MTHSLGYSRSPLSKKLGLRSNHSVYLINPPDRYWTFFETVPDDIYEVDAPETESVDFVHLFCRNSEELRLNGKKCKSVLKKTGLFWVSWPKGSSSIPTDLKRDAIREHMLSIGLVDVKVASINEDWSGLKFVYRTKDR